MNSIEDIRTYMGGDNSDVPVYQPAVDHLQYLLDKCQENNLPLPEIFPWYGGDGVQAEWEFENDWYIEINISSKGISGFFLKDSCISCSFNDIKDAFLLVKVFLEKVVTK